MKPSILLLFGMLIMHSTAEAQTSAQTYESAPVSQKPEGYVDFGVFYSPVLSKPFVGLDLALKGYVTGKWSMGISVGAAQKKTGDPYGYIVGTPIVSYTELGWVNSYEAFRKGPVTLTADLNNGVIISRLGDNDIQEKYRTRYGYGHRAKKIATDWYYMLEPGIDVAVKLGSSGKNDVALIEKTKYHFAIGDSKYANTNAFSNFYISLGIAIVGLK